MTTKDKAKDQLDEQDLLSRCNTTSAKIRTLLANGRSRGEVAKLLGIRYQHVRNVEITPVKTPKQ